MSRKAPIFWRRPPDRPGFGHGFDEDNPDLAVRDGGWKYYVNYDGGDRQLYDLRNDISETTNVVDEHPGVSRRLHDAVFAWNVSMHADAGDPAFDSQLGERQMKIYLPYDGHSCPSRISTDLGRLQRVRPLFQTLRLSMRSNHAKFHLA